MVPSPPQAQTPGIDEMPKSEIEKKNPYLEFREEKRKMSRSVFWFENRTRIFAQKIEKSAIFSNFEKRKRNFEIKSHDARVNRDVKISNFS